MISEYYLEHIKDKPINPDKYRKWLLLEAKDHIRISEDELWETGERCEIMEDIASKYLHAAKTLTSNQIINLCKKKPEIKSETLF